MWENAYLSIKTQKLPGPLSWPWTLAVDCSLHSCNSTLLHQQLSASEAGAPPWPWSWIRTCKTTNLLLSDGFHTNLNELHQLILNVNWRITAQQRQKGKASVIQLLLFQCVFNKFADWIFTENICRESIDQLQVIKKRRFKTKLQIRSTAQKLVSLYLFVPKSNDLKYLPYISQKDVFSGAWNRVLGMTLEFIVQPGFSQKVGRCK